jgi:hypothetical protein
MTASDEIPRPRSETDPERPFRFPPLAEEHFESRLKQERARDPHRGRYEHGLIPEKLEEHADGSLDEIFLDGHIEHYTAAEIEAAEERGAQYDADELLLHGPPAKSLEEAVTVTQVPVPWDVPSLAQEELLVGAGTLLDHLDELGVDACEELCRLLNDYGSQRWGMLPCFEVYLTPEDWPQKRVLGYRLNAFEAVVLPDDAYDRSLDKQVAWSTDGGLSQLDRVTEILTDSSDELIDGTRLLCERGPSMDFWLVRNGRIYGRRDWPPLYRALEEGKGRLIRPVPELVTPLLVCSTYDAEAATVATLMQQAKDAMYHDEEEAARAGDALLSDELLAAQERQVRGSSLGSWQLQRIKRKQAGRDRIQEVWGALMECNAHGRALLPAWDHPEVWDELILLRQSIEGLDFQLHAYASSHLELGLVPPERERSFLGRDLSTWEPADPSPGSLPFSHFAREAWKDPRYWWTHVSRRDLDAARGRWVALDRFHSVLASGDDPEALKETAGWRSIVSVPEQGYDEGLLIANPLPDPEQASEEDD